jgi:AraC-like DNA-binding protein
MVKLDELSRLTHMSKRNFFRAFQAAAGSTPILLASSTCDSLTPRRCCDGMRKT